MEANIYYNNNNNNKTKTKKGKKSKKTRVKPTRGKINTNNMTGAATNRQKIYEKGKRKFI